jgi:hypothetical protein
LDYNVFTLVNFIGNIRIEFYLGLDKNISKLNYCNLVNFNYLFMETKY